MKRIVAIVVALMASISLMGQDNRIVHVGIDASVDCFLNSDNRVSPSLGLGVRARLGEHDQWLNLVGGGYEFDFIGSNYGAWKAQVGLASRHLDFRVFYKPYQGDLGAGFTYYF
jgi:hypothetical protein